MPKINWREKFLSALLSAFIFAAVLAAINYTPVSQQLDGMAYFSLPQLFLLYGLYALPVFIIVGVPISVLLDKLARRVKLHPYAADLIIYTLGGIVVNIWFFISLFNSYGVVWDQTIMFLLMGIGASLIFLHVSYVMRIAFKTK